MVHRTLELVRGGTWISLWRTVPKVLPPTVTAIREKVVDYALGPDGRGREAMITGAKCYEACQIYAQALERAVEPPREDERHGSPGLLVQRESAIPPAILSIP